MPSTQRTSEHVSDVMTINPVTMNPTSPLIEAARQMKSSNVGDVIVLNDGKICGVVTDRDIVVRAVAEDRDPHQIKLGDICSREVVTLGPTDTVDHAVELMRTHAVRRLPVTDAGKPVGIVSIGDLALVRDPDSALADISAAPANT